MLSRIITKIFSIIDTLRWNSYYKTCEKRGMKLGTNVALSHGINFGSEPYLIEIGDFSRVSNSVSFINHSGGQLLMRTYEDYKDVRIFGRIKIGEKCFIGAKSTISYGVEIGNRSIIGTGSVVTESIPADSVYAGVPAKFICTTKDYYERKKLENIQYPRELEAERSKLDQFLIKNLPHTYKPIKK
ncbi:acyltransferase [Chryseobacterium echinoideorum]|uniref:acyltransferase n=1 Tax=Chryseobacterium echinoideorum TaxID=1549648 RepID=UPI001184B5C2|nr:acyltransferase [Chryseobacterium echinoideorum]